MIFKRPLRTGLGIIHTTSDCSDGQTGKFFLTPKDTDELFAKFQEHGPCLVVHSRSPVQRPRIMESVSWEEDGRLWLFLFLVRPDDVDAIVMKEVPAQGYWVVDSLRSPVIEFTRSFYQHGSIRAGRLWCEVRYYDQEERLTCKSPSFVAWAELVLKLARKELQKRGPYHFGFQADALIQSGRLHILK